MAHRRGRGRGCLRLWLHPGASTGGSAVGLRSFRLIGGTALHVAEIVGAAGRVRAPAYTQRLRRLVEFGRPAIGASMRATQSWWPRDGYCDPAAMPPRPWRRSPRNRGSASHRLSTLSVQGCSGTRGLTGIPGLRSGSRYGDDTRRPDRHRWTSVCRSRPPHGDRDHPGAGDRHGAIRPWQRHSATALWRPAGNRFGEQSTAPSSAETYPLTLTRTCSSICSSALLLPDLHHGPPS